MLAWMVYALALASLLALAAVCAERLLTIRRLPTRAPWILALALSVLLPLGGTRLLAAAASLLQPRLPASMATLQRAATEQMAADQWVEPLLVTSRRPGTLDAVLRGVWWSSSLATLVALSLPSLAFMRKRRLWQDMQLEGVAVLVSQDLGPAVIGHWRPRIVIPRWVLETPLSQQRMVLAHELQHIRAGDPRWLLGALLAVVAMPWNLPLWWQMRRLRRAIEVDCDARVLDEGMDGRLYGETLLAVGERQTVCPTGVAGMAEPKAFLERRMALLFRKGGRRWTVSAAMLAGLTVSLLVAAAEVRPSHEEASAGPAPAPRAIPLGAPLSAYEGVFRLGPRTVLEVRRNGEQLVGKLTGFDPVPLTVAGEERLVAHEGAARIDFTPNGQAPRNEVVLTLADIPQKGVRIAEAEAAENTLWLAKHVVDRIRANAPYRDGAATVRAIEEGLLAGDPPYKSMNPPVVMATRAQLPELQKLLSGGGAFESVTFMGVDPNGWDRYEVHRQSAVHHWIIEMDEQGVVTGVRLVPAE